MQNDDENGFDLKFDMLLRTQIVDDFITEQTVNTGSDEESD